MPANTVSMQPISNQGAPRHTTWRRASILATLLLAALSPAWSDVRTTSGGASSKKLCYCDCDSKPGATICTKMCELPKYQNHAWAASCQKKQNHSTTTPVPNQGSGSKKR